MAKLLTFAQVMAKTKNPHLLLGNGFSMAYDSKRFSFTSLLQSAIDSSIINKDDLIYKVFEKLGTADFESVMKILDDSQKIIKIYDENGDLVKTVKKDSEQQTLQLDFLTILSVQYQAF